MTIINRPVTTLIPQRPPFVMVDSLQSCDDQGAVSRFLVSADNIFVDAGRLSAAALIENMAQTCAVRMGFLGQQHGEKVRVGVIGDVSRCKVSRLPLVGEVLTTSIQIVLDMQNMMIVEAVTSVGDESIASARLKIAVSEV